MTLLVVTNTATAAARRRLPDLHAALPESARLRHQVTEHQAAADALIGHGDWQPDDLLVINGGDGSVQHALTVLLDHCPPERLPRFACLPGGSTNMTAYDVNAHRRYAECVTTLKRLAAGQRIPEAPRRVVAVQEGARTRCGLFFGIGTIVQGIEYFQQHLRGEGGRHELAAGVALARTLWGIARHQPPFAEALGARVCAPPLWPGDGRALSLRLLLATTLDRLFLGIRPFWGSACGEETTCGDETTRGAETARSEASAHGAEAARNDRNPHGEERATGADKSTGALKITAVERRAPGFLARVPRLLRGRPDERMTPADGYHSGRGDALTLDFAGSYTLDGELFARTGGPGAGNEPADGSGDGRPGIAEAAAGPAPGVTASGAPGATRSPFQGDSMRIHPTAPVRFVPL